MPPKRVPLRIKSAQYDHSGGVVGLVSTEELRRVRYLRDALNIVFRPGRSYSVRGGTRDIINATLAEPPTSIGKYYNAAANRVFVATNSGSSLGKLWRVSTSSYVQQTVPWTTTSQKVKFVNINGVIVAVQKGAVVPPMFSAQSNAAETWLTCTLPAPDSTALTLTPSTNAAGMLTLLATYRYRLRHRFANGSSQTSGIKSKTLVGTENRITISTIPINPTGRTDYLGWTLERTKKNGDDNGPFYLVADGIATPYVDDAADAGLGGIFERSVDALHGTPPNLDGLIEHKGRLFGWAGSTVYLSQPVFGGDEATGIFNWQADQIFALDKDDGDTIQTAVVQSDRLVMFKRRSTHVIEGDDPDSFRVRRIADVGSAGYRAAAADGVHVYFISGDGIIFRLSGDRARPFGQFEAGLWLADLDLTRISDAVVVNHLGDAMLFAAVFEPNLFNSHTIAYDLLTETWTRHNLRITDAVVQKDESEFSRATLLYVDPVAVVPAVGVAAGTNPSFVSWSSGAGDQETMVQSLDYLGAPRWGAGVQVSNSLNLSQSPQVSSVMTNDGAGGVIIAYIDRRAGDRYDVYAQRISSAGTILWAAGGVPVCVAGIASTRRDYLQIVADGAGGAIICWSDNFLTPNPTRAVYAIRINSSGALVSGWTANGTRVAAQTTLAELLPRMLADGAGGAFFLVDQLSATGSLDFQHLSSAGAALAGASGTAVATGVAGSGRMVSDAAGGVIVAYGVASLKAKRLNSNGSTNWAEITVSGSAYATNQPHAMVGNGSGGAVVFWIRSGNDRIDGRVINQDGTFATLGVIIDIPGATGYGVLVGDEPLRFARAVRRTDGTYWFAWSYGPSDVPDRVRVTRLDSTLSTLTATNVRATGLGGDVHSPTLVTDGADGCIISWTDTRTDALGDIYAQRLNALGVAQWTANGVVLASGATQQADQFAIFTDAPVGEQPGSRVAGYHVWSGFAGFTDFADANSLNGLPIHITSESHFLDDGYPDDLKDYDRVELHIEDLTTADFQVTLDFDEVAPTVTIPLSQVSTIDLWSDSAADNWSDTATDLWTGGGRTDLESGVTAGSIAKRHLRRIDANLTEPVTITGMVVDSRLLPDRSY